VVLPYPGSARRRPAAGAVSFVAHYNDDRAAILEAALEAGELPGPACGIEDGAAVVLTSSGAEALRTRDHGGVHRMTIRNGHVKTVEGCCFIADAHVHAGRQDETTRSHPGRT